MLLIGRTTPPPLPRWRGSIFQSGPRDFLSDKFGEGGGLGTWDATLAINQHFLVLEIALHCRTKRERCNEFHLVG